MLRRGAIERTLAMRRATSGTRCLPTSVSTATWNRRPGNASSAGRRFRALGLANASAADASLPQRGEVVCSNNGRKSHYFFRSAN